VKGPNTLLEHEEHWRTRMGIVFAGQRVVFRGKDLFHQLKNLRWMDLLLYGITGRRFDNRQIDLFEGIWVICTSYPDPRIWNNRVAALAGTSRATATLAVSAATAISEAAIYGGQPVIRSIDFLRRSRKSVAQGQDIVSVVIRELKRFRGIAGYGRPLVNKDERIFPLLELARSLELDEGEYFLHAFLVERTLNDLRYRMKMNIAALIAALAADQGLSAEEYYQYMTLCFSVGFLPCFIDTSHRSEGSFLPLRCTRINYKGTSRRNWT
jgi:citrate synthase